MTKKVKVIIKEIKGKCVHKVGEEFELGGDKITASICGDALHSIYPYMYAMAHGADLWPTVKEKLVCSPDHKNLAIFELKIVDSS